MAGCYLVEEILLGYIMETTSKDILSLMVFENNLLLLELN